MYNITSNGLVGGIKTAGSNALAIEAAGDFSGATVAIKKFMGVGNTADVNDPRFVTAIELTGEAVGENTSLTGNNGGMRYSIGSESQYIIEVTGGGTPDINLQVLPLVGEPS